MKNAIIDFFKNKGYIFIALLCITAVVAVGISVINSGNNTNGEPVISYNTPASKPITPTNSTDETPAPMPTSASKPVDDSQNNPPSQNDTSTPGKIIIIKPVDGEIQTEYAAKKLVYNSTLQEWRTHSGVDIAASAGSIVKAAANGRVKEVYKDNRLGVVIVLEHGDFTTIYGNF